VRSDVNVSPRWVIDDVEYDSSHPIGYCHGGLAEGAKAETKLVVFRLEP
jgi:hypothetical protein